MRPDERLPTKRTASIGSRVPPAVTSTRRPSRSFGAAASAGLDRGEDLRRLGQPADAPLPGRAERAGAGLEHDRAARAQRREVGLGGGVLVHRVVHRGREDERAAAGERGAR